MTNDFSKREEWHRMCKDARVVIRHMEISSDMDLCDGRGPHRWYVYAYVYNLHHLFPLLPTDSLRQLPLRDMPLHCGVCFVTHHWDSTGETCGCVQVGCDYNHLWDEKFTRAEHSKEVFSDARILVDWLDNYEIPPQTLEQRYTPTTSTGNE